FPVVVVRVVRGVLRGGEEVLVAEHDLVVEVLVVLLGVGPGERGTGAVQVLPEEARLDLSQGEQRELARELAVVRLGRGELGGRQALEHEQEADADDDERHRHLGQGEARARRLHLKSPSSAGSRLTIPSDMRISPVSGSCSSVKLRSNWVWRRTTTWC